MAECRFFPWCSYIEDHGCTKDSCRRHQPMPDVDALLTLADEIEFDGAEALDDEDWCKPLLVEYARRIREACGEVM